MLDADIGRRQALGLAVLAVTAIPGYLLSRDEERAALAEVGERALERLGVGLRSDAQDGEGWHARRPTRRQINAYIRATAERYDVPPRLVAAIIEAESDFNPRAVSRRGARGLMQLMPAVASSLDVHDSFDPYANINGGVRHLRWLMDRYDGELPLVIAAYNAGEQAVADHRGVPPYPETRRYVARVMRRLGRDAGEEQRRARQRRRLEERA